MCGISGIWQTDHSSFDDLAQYAHRMSNSIRHRGPDHSGVWIEPQFSLALIHTRLAILDLSPTGHQPMTSPSGRYVMTFNGEIYNHQSIRAELDQRGLLIRPWKGTSDTETLLASFEAFGISKTLLSSIGMFAIAIWDKHRRTLTLIRDRFGEKPLYWGWVTVSGVRSLVFSSELSSIKSLPNLTTPNINPSAVYSYFSHGYISAPHSVYTDIFQLQPGHSVEISATDVGTAPSTLPTPSSWWNLQSFAELNYSNQFTSTEPYLIDALENVLSHSVSRQSISDAPLGCFLSGGIDSTLVTSLLQHNQSAPVRTMTVSFPDSVTHDNSFDEAPYAHSVASYLGTDHTEIPLTSRDALNLIPDISSIYSEPFADASQLPTFLVCREARALGLKVALSGDGADEFFGGYNRHSLAPIIYRRFHKFNPCFIHLVVSLLSYVPVTPKGLLRDKKRKLLSAISSASSLDSVYRALTELIPNPHAIFQPSFQTQIPHSIPPYTCLPYSPTNSEQVMLSDSLSYLPNDILVKVDRSAMSVGLETRAPFLDHNVVEFALQLPLTYKINSHNTSFGTKWLLRQLLYKFVPPELINRPKSGFSVPIGSWLRGPLRPWAEDLISPSLLSTQGYLDPNYVTDLWHSHLKGADHTSHLWSILMWQSWLLRWSA